MNGTKKILTILAAAGLLLTAGSSFAGTYLTGMVSWGTNVFLMNPTVAVYDVKCKAKSPVCAAVWDQSPDFTYQDDFHVTSLCIAPVAAKGKGNLQYYYNYRDLGQFSPDACTPGCTEALVTVQCDIAGTDCDDSYALDVECYGGEFAAGFPKRIP
jgi:hypothetical protein